MSIINKILMIGFLLVASAYIIYFGAIAGLSAIILTESLLLALLISLLVRQRLGNFLSSITYVVLLTIIIEASTNISDIITQHVYTGILLAVDIILILLNTGFMK